MQQVQAAGWQQTLAEVEQAINDCSAALDRYEKAFGGVLQAGGTEPAAPAVSAASGEQVAGWEERLSFATQQAGAVEALLSEEEARWKVWQDKLTAWWRSLEKPPG